MHARGLSGTQGLTRIPNNKSPECRGSCFSPARVPRVQFTSDTEKPPYEGASRWEVGSPEYQAAAGVFGAALLATAGLDFL